MWHDLAHTQLTVTPTLTGLLAQRNAEGEENKTHSPIVLIFSQHELDTTVKEKHFTPREKPRVSPPNTFSFVALLGGVYQHETDGWNLLTLAIFQISPQAHTTMEMSSNSGTFFALSPASTARTSVKGSPPPLKLNLTTPTTTLSPRGIGSALPLIPDDFDEVKLFGKEEDRNQRKPALAPRPAKHPRTRRWHPDDMLSAMPTCQQKIFLPILADSDDESS